MSAQHTPESVADAILKAAGSQPVSGYMPYYGDKIVLAAKPFADAANLNAELLAALKAMDETLCDGFETQAKRMAGRKALIAARAAIAKAGGAA